jgi:phenylacetate-CoA ligase
MPGALRMPPADQPLYDPEVQTMARDELRALQEERMRRQVRRIFERPIPLFRRHLASAGVRDPRDVATLDDLARIPTLNKNHLRESEAALPPFGDYRGSPPESWVRIGQTTGSSGRPTLIVWTEKDLEVDYAASARARWRWGLRPGMKFAQAHPYGLYAGGWHMCHGVEAMGCLDIPSGPPATEEHMQRVVRLWKRLQPDMYRLFGNAGVKYYEAAQRMGIDPERELNFKKAGDHPSSQFDAVSAGLEALGMLGSQCAEKNGAHLCEDLVIVDVIDRRTGAPVGNHERGSLVVTILEKDNFLLRYDLEDLVTVNLDPCPCGETHRRLFYDGRVSDAVPVLVGDGGRVKEILPIDAALLLYDFSELATPSVEYQLVRPRSAAPTLRVRVEVANESAAEAAALRARIAQRFAERLGVVADVETLPRGALPRFDYKATRVVAA